MPYIVPNDFLANKETIDLDDTVFSVYSTKTQNENVEVRVTTHCLIILLSGAKVINFRDNHVNLDAKQMIFLAQNNYFMNEIITNQEPYNALLIYFNDKFIENFIKKYHLNLPMTKQKTDFFKINYGTNTAYSLNIELLNLYMKQNNTKLLNIKLEEIFLNCLNNTQFISFLNSTQQTSSSRISNIIENNIDQIETLDDMCKLTNLSTNQLRKYFLKKYNQKPKQWLNEQRLQKAMTLVKNSDKSITEIAQNCGYATLSWFTHSFKMKFHQTPKEIRQNL